MAVMIKEYHRWLLHSDALRLTNQPKQSARDVAREQRFRMKAKTEVSMTLEGSPEVRICIPRNESSHEEKTA